MRGHWNVGRYQFIWWRTWAYDCWEDVSDFTLGRIYDRAGRYGFLEIRRFVAPPPPVG